MITATGATIVGRARVIGEPNIDRALATRLAVAGMLAGADLRPPGLPPAAVLIVNRLALPASHRLVARPGARLSPDWERAARDAMADLYRRAARPLDALPSPGCPAVLFSDEAELLACLALDISLGRAAERWWWRTYAKRWGSLTPRILAPLLAESPRLAPATLRLLAERDAVSGVLQHLSPDEARLLLDLVCDAFDAPRPALPVSQFASWQSRPAFDPASTQPGARIDPTPPWHSFTPPVLRLTGLSPEGICLLGVALTLAHSPSVAQTAAFAHALAQWWQSETSERRGNLRHEHPDPPRNLDERSSDHAALTGDVFPPPVHAAPPATAIPAGTSGRPGSGSQVDGGDDDTGQRPAAALQQDAALAVAKRIRAETDAGTPRDHPATEPDRSSESSRMARAEPSTAQQNEPAPWLDGVLTELGGALFLMNLMQRLDLPGCFEADWQLASQVGPWGVLELVARGLLAEELPTFPKVGNSGPLLTDPLWPALAAIDGRRVGELPAGAVSIPERLRVPAGWARWLGTVGDGAGQGELASPSLAMTAKVPAPLDGPLLVGVSRELRAWLAAVTPLLRTILARVLGDEFDLTSGLLLRCGQLYVTSSHVDLILPLGSVSMPVRIAGLDFDPGWLPAFGRVVQFHYE